MLALVALLLAADLSVQCSVDDDCAVAKPCDCSCCGAPVQAMTKTAAKTLRQYCARVGPCSQKGCEADDCLPAENTADFTAVCKANRCVRVAKPKSAVCKSDDDCTIATDCGCGCCPNQPQALTKPEAKAMKDRCAKVGECSSPCAKVVECTQAATPEAIWSASCVQGACTREARKTSK